jgi:hypothetical protein
MSETKITLMYDFRMYIFFMFVHTIKVCITFIITPIIISAIEGHTKKKLISVHDVIFHFRISRYSILVFFVLVTLIFHVTYLNCLFMLKMSMTLLLPMGDLVCLILVLFVFLFLVMIEIGSLARFTCFSNVDLSCMF